MARNHILNTFLSCCLACLAPALVQAAEHHGVIKFAGLPVPGATVTATMGDKKMVAVTGPDGLYSFPDLADGVWNLQVEMLQSPEDGSGRRAQRAKPGMGAQAPAVR